jgi:DNA-binding XRE family transcriptional regulator
MYFSSRHAEYRHYTVNFSASLKQLRKKAGLTQAELADAIGTTQGAVGHYEMGIKAPELSKLPARPSWTPLLFTMI